MVVKVKNSTLLQLRVMATFIINYCCFSYLQHTIQGKMACAPFFFRLNKGYTEINMVSGIWEIFTYGLFALYKSDWIEVDGFDVMQYNTTWGGEDADLLDRYVVIMWPLSLLSFPSSLSPCSKQDSYYYVS